MATQCYQQFLKSLKTTTLVGFLAILDALEAEIGLDLIKALARKETLSNLLSGAKKSVSSLASSKFAQIKGSIKALNLDAFKDCPTTNSLSRLIVSVSDSKVGQSDSARFNELKLELSAQEKDNEVSKLQSRKRNVQDDRVGAQAEFATRSDVL